MKYEVKVTLNKKESDLVKAIIYLKGYSVQKYSEIITGKKLSSTNLNDMIAGKRPINHKMYLKYFSNLGVKFLDNIEWEFERKTVR